MSRCTYSRFIVCLAFLLLQLVTLEHRPTHERSLNTLFWYLETPRHVPACHGADHSLVRKLGDNDRPKSVRLRNISELWVCDV